jgi:glucose-6-phosphate 1-dehydrogenase
MFQNHMMQLTALAAAEPASWFQADRVRDEKVKLFRSLRPMPLDDLYEHLVLGQYEAGTVGGNPVPAYREEKGVDPQSLTPTYGCMRVFVDNWRWQGVPFYLTSGKRLAAKVTRLDIQFKEVPHSLFRQVLDSPILANRLSLVIDPREAITLTFQVKQPGQAIVLRTVAMGFDYQSGGRGAALSAYEKALVDVLRGDQTLFWRQDGLEQCWSFLEPILQECESCRERAGHLHRYPAGSWGPDKAQYLLPPGAVAGFTA